VSRIRIDEEEQGFKHVLLFEESSYHLEDLEVTLGSACLEVVETRGIHYSNLCLILMKIGILGDVSGKRLKSIANGRYVFPDNGVYKLLFGISPLLRVKRIASNIQMTCRNPWHP
jgi:hypothetical protein